jgi:hypothetical protein
VDSGSTGREDSGVLINCSKVVSRSELSVELRGSSSSPPVVENEGSDEATRDVAAKTTEVTITDATLADSVPFSNSPTPLANNLSSPEKSGKNLVHQNAIRTPLSSTRCFTMNSTTRTKNVNAERMRTRSSQSVFSRAVMRCLEVVRREVRVEWVEVVERRVVVEVSVGCAHVGYNMGEREGDIPSIWTERTERSSSLCISPIARRRASVTSALAFMSVSSSL